MTEPGVDFPVLKLDANDDWEGSLANETDREAAVLAVEKRAWMIWRSSEGLQVRMALGLGPDRITVRQVWLSIDPEAERNEPINAADLREVPLGRIVALINSPVTATAIQIACGYFPESEPSLPLGPEYEYDPDQAYRLEGAELKRRDDSFYTGVALAWATAVARGSKEPAALIAEANNVPRSTVYGWVREARRRGVMAPTGQGPRAPRGRRSTE